MGIGYAPNKELYTEHFLKPLRAAFSDRDLQVCKDKYELTIFRRFSNLMILVPRLTW